MDNQLTQLAPEIQELQVLGAFASQLCKSEALPACYKNAANVLVALQTGKEMGLKPMQSLNSLYIVNGKIQIWGSAQVQLLKQHGWSLKVIEHTDKICKLQINKGDQMYEYSTLFTDLPAGSKAKAFAPKEKLYYHTVSRLIRFYCPEVLGGQANLYNEVELEDIKQQEPSRVVDSSAAELDRALSIIDQAETLEELEQVKEYVEKSTNEDLKTEYADKQTKLQDQSV